jgi:pyruvate/2-oxoglutarate dehydrogenase complex dihydrolipoamide acyltransferase (E2) component
MTPINLIRNVSKEDSKRKKHVRWFRIYVFYAVKSYGTIIQMLVIIGDYKIAYDFCDGFTAALVTQKGPMVPVVRKCRKLNFSAAVVDTVISYSDGQITVVDDMRLVNFTITNGGVFSAASCLIHH